MALTMDMCATGGSGLLLYEMTGNGDNDWETEALRGLLRREFGTWTRKEEKRDRGLTIAHPRYEVGWTAEKESEDIADARLDQSASTHFS